jgi:hypothetical protein
MRYLLLLVAVVGCSREPRKTPAAEAKPDVSAEVAAQGEPTFATYKPEPGKSDGYTAPLLPAELGSEIVLLMPDSQLAERVDIDALAEGMKAVMAEVAGLYGRGDIELSPMALYLAAKPGKGIKTWAVGIEAPLKAQDAAMIEKKTSSVVFPAVRSPIALSLVYPRKGVEIPGGKAPMPKEWVEASGTAGRTLAIPDELLSQVWPN